MNIGAVLRRAAAGAVALGTLVATAVVAGPGVARAAITPAAGIQIRAGHSAKCLAIKGGSLVDQGALIQYTCGDNYANDKFRVEARTGGYLIVGNQSGKCLADPGNSTANNTAIVQLTCADTYRNNLWKFEAVAGRTTFRVRNVFSDKCLNVPSSSQDINVAVVQYTCGTSTTALNDQFYFPPSLGSTIGALSPQADGPIVAVQGGAAAGAALGPLVYAYTNDAGRLYRAYQSDPGSTSTTVWETVGGLDQYAGHPAVAVQADGRVQVAARNAVDGDVNLTTQTTKGVNTFGTLADVGGTSPEQIVTGKLPDGKLVGFEVFNGRLWHLPQDGTSLPIGKWRIVGEGALVGEPAVVTIRDGLRVFVRNSSGAVLTAAYRNGALGDFTNLGGSFTGTPSAVTVTGYYTWVAMRDTDGRIVVKGEHSDGTFDAAWTPISDVVAAGDPSIVMDPLSGALAVVFLTTNGYVQPVLETGASSGTWHDVAANERPVRTDPKVLTFASNGGSTWGYTTRDATLTPYLFTRSDVQPGARAAGTSMFTGQALPRPPAN
ncbi:RICIN domain-containing protein [Actinoplanes sp. RD1]|uniref:RICIN domain-containing protein n=1 Tax=Actinoplanes sp. RD1 TaxID=3064538 RepID=UPI002740B781|nr:RICIN domain-containing protein [Actinoplanes sp. RD1]